MTSYMYDAAVAPKGVNWRQHGALALSHYLTGSYATSSPQIQATLDAGLGVNLNWERMANALVGASRAQGQTFARDALAAIPKSCPRDGASVSVKFSVDVEVAKSNIGICDDAFRGCNDVLRGEGLMVACYAEGALIEHLHGLGLVQGKQWLSASGAFPGFDANGPHVGAVQSHDAAGNWIGTDVHGTDRNTLIDPANFGIWWPAGSPFVYHAPPAQPVKKGNIDMVLVQVSKADCKARGVTWPGVFTSDGVSVRHVAHTSDITAWQKLGVPGPGEISLDEYYALGGK